MFSCIYTKYTKTLLMKLFNLLPVSFLAFSFFLQLNAQIDCCGLVVSRAIKSPPVQNFVPRNQIFGSSPSSIVSPFSKHSLSSKNTGFSPQVNRQNFSSKTQNLKPVKLHSSSFVSNARKRYCGVEVSRSGVSNSSSSVQSTPSPLVVYYMERPVKSIRVSSVPDIQRWENALRKNMALNGRNKGKVDELLSRIRNHYGDQSIEAKDYSTSGKGYVPSKTTRNLAESRIERTVKSMALFYEKSRKSRNGPFKSAGGDGFLKGKLSFVNTELDKLGNPEFPLRSSSRSSVLQMTGRFRPLILSSHSSS